MVLTGLVCSEPVQVNISGATLFQEFFRSYASTNDYIDVDRDGVWGFSLDDLRTPDQLAYDYPSESPENRWWVMYRGVGSGNGLLELVNYVRRSPGMEIGTLSEGAGLINRAKFFDNGVVGPGNANNPGCAPMPIKSIDIAVMDVPTKWFVQSGNISSSGWNCKPGQEGYGQNPVADWENNSQSNKLKLLRSTIDPNIVLNTNVDYPNEDTVFDTQIAWVPVAIIANAGVGIENIAMEELRYLFATGRMPSGENLAVVTRDAGSGTRNAAMNSLGIDPSWGRGDNCGKKISVDGEEGRYTGKLGPGFQYNNLGGSALVENAVQQCRLAIGYTGLMGSSRAEGDAAAGAYEVLNVRKTNKFVRPSVQNLVDNLDPDSGWQIGGSETFATVGDPFASEHPGNPPMDNAAASDYIRNIVISIRDFVSAPDDPQYSMPGEYLATHFTLVAGLTGIPSDSDPATFIANPGYNPNVNSYIKAHSKFTLPQYGTVAPAGKCPLRAQLAAGTYSDGRTCLGTDDYYTDSGSNKIRANAKLSLRNRIAGDFKYDGVRNTDDCLAMLHAFRDPRGFEAGNNNKGDGYVVVEIIGDLDGDGNFDVNDIRYWADGLAMNPVTGKLDRKLGFELVDTFWTENLADPNRPVGNFFNTRLATGRPYRKGSGWSAADIAGKSRPRPGAKPVGSDGVIDDKDIDYICLVMRGGLRASAFGLTPRPEANLVSKALSWGDLDDAVSMDLSCDINGDMAVDRSDVDVLVHDILGTKYGDVNLEGVVDQKDLDVISANINSSFYGRGWAEGDITGDGYVTESDLDLAKHNM